MPVVPGKPTTTIPDGGLFSAAGEAQINAPATIVYESLIDTAKWAEWGTFVTSVDIDKQADPAARTSLLAVGTEMTFHVQMTPSFKTTNQERGVLVEGPPKPTDAPGTIYRVCWANQSSALVPKFMLAAERVNEIEVGPNGTCLYRTWQTFTGPYAKIVKWKFGQALDDRLDDWTRELKAYAEKVAKEQTQTQT